MQFGAYLVYKPGQVTANQRMAFRYGQLCVVNAAWDIDHRRLALRDDARCNQPQVDQCNSTGYRHRHHEVEHLERFHSHVRGDRSDQQVGRSANGRAHAADQRGQAHRQQDTGGGRLAADGRADQHRQHQHDDRGVVHEGAQDGAHHQGGQQRNRGRFSPEPAQSAGHRFQRTGSHQRLSCNHKRTYCHQGLVAKTVEEVRRFDLPRAGAERE